MASSNTHHDQVPHRYSYDVFVSFRGEDTRRSFVSHLHDTLGRHGINTFKDDKSLERGKSISPAIKKSIRESRFSVIVFSKNYAFSTWCLEELVEIMHCKDANAQTVLPIFLDVGPSEVSNQSGSFRQAFLEHEKKMNSKMKGDHIWTSSIKKFVTLFDTGIPKVSSVEDHGEHEDKFHLGMEQIQSWRSCLTEAAEIAGWDSRDNKDEAKFIEEIAIDVMKKLTRISSKQSLKLVGMDPRAKKIEDFLRIGLDEVHMVGILGFGGIGKTTLARFVYQRLSSRFDGICFLDRVSENVQNYGIDFLRSKLVGELKAEKERWDMGLNLELKNAFRRKKVLIVLDDVDDIEQLRELAGGHDWFGPGSRIIITTRDKDILSAHGVYEKYDVQRLNDFESLQLFHQLAFRNRDATDEFMDLGRQIVNYTGGFPLVVKVLASSLFDKSLLEWKNELSNLKSSTREVRDLLRIGFNRLDVVQKKIFLDIACFFKGEDINFVTECFDGCGMSPDIVINVLCDKCLISISDNKIWIHDSLQEMGHEIVRQEHDAVGRLLETEDVPLVLSDNKGIEKVEIVTVDGSKGKDVLTLPSIISQMPSLRLLKIYCSTDNGSNTQQLPQHLVERYLFRYGHSFSNELICFRWEAYPLKYLPYDFHPQNLIELDMPRSNLKYFSTTMKRFVKLKFINLRYSKNLIKTPDFSEIPNLEKLDLGGCTNLTKVHRTIASHKSLQLVNLTDCTSLCKFPSPIEMKALKFFILSGCSNLQVFPEIGGNMECLLRLHVDGTAIKRLPESSKELTGLEVLRVGECQDLKIPPAIRRSSKLEIIKETKVANKEEPSWAKWGQMRSLGYAALPLITLAIL